MKTTSVFARSLKQLLDETEFYSRAEWSEFFGVSEPALSQWVNDRTIPRADLLSMAIDLLKTRGGTSAEEPLRAIEAIMDAPSETISPIGARFAPDLRTYLRVRPLVEVGRLMRVAGEEEGLAAAVSRQIEKLRPTSHAPPAHVSTANPDTFLHGLGPAWRTPRLVRTDVLHGRHPQVSIDEVVSLPRIILTGSVGSGKTTMLRYIAAKHATWQQAEFVSLRHYSAVEFETWLTERAALKPEQPVIIDGVDEMPMDQRDKVATLIDRFSREAPRAPLVVASRPVKELYRLSGFERFSIAPLSDIDLVAEVTRSSLASQMPIEVDRFLCHLTERETLRPALRNPLFLKIAWSLFENNAVTPFAEAIVVKEYMHALFNLDHWKGFSRVREPWATSHSLLGLLGEISLHLLLREEAIFDETKLAQWIETSSSNVPVGKLLDLLLVNGLLTEDDQRYSFSHRVFKEYFAGRFVLESAASAVDYFKAAPKRSKMHGAIRMACSLASDATPLLETVMSSPESKDNKYVLLAQMLAQPIEAQPKVLAQSCRMLVGWLSQHTSNWKVVEGKHETIDVSARWFVHAHVGRSKEADDVAATLRSVHQARSGPACRALTEELREARSPFLPIFAEAMDVEGRLNVDFGSGSMARGDARVAVESLQLA